METETGELVLGFLKAGTDDDVAKKYGIIRNRSGSYLDSVRYSRSNLAAKRNGYGKSSCEREDFETTGNIIEMTCIKWI